MPVLLIRHLTTYDYRKPVAFGEHRLMFRPRDSHDLRLIETGMTISPTAEIRWSYDVFGNSIATASFAEMASRLTFDAMIRVEQFPLAAEEIRLAPHVQHYPWRYSTDEIADVGRSDEPGSQDPYHSVIAWARAFVQSGGPVATYDLLTRMTQSIKAGFLYRRREEGGVQEAAETLALGSGSCRDFAYLLMEAARSLGFAARFVSGYLFDDALAGSGAVGGGATHAWAQIYLPGPGWVEFDPTNGSVGGRNLIRVAVARAPTQAAPVSGSFVGGAQDMIGMTVNVTVTVE